MTQNPYESPKEAGQTATERPRLRFMMVLAGLLFGGNCGGVGGFIGGAMTGATYRSFHDVYHGGPDAFGLFTKIETLSDWALLHGVLAMLPLAVLGGVLGAIRGGLSPTRGPLSIVAIMFFAIAALLVGFVNGALALDSERHFVRHFWEGPGAGALFGLVSGALTWTVFRNRFEIIVQNPARCTPFLLHNGAVIAGGFLVWFATILFGGLGTDILQVASGFGVIVSATILGAIAWATWNLRVG